MSIESFKAFMTRIAEDSALRKELATIAGDGITFEQLAEAAAERGFRFSAEDVTRKLNAVASEGELSDDDLENVAGGVGTPGVFNDVIKFGHKWNTSYKLDSAFFNNVFKF